MDTTIFKCVCKLGCVVEHVNENNEVCYYFDCDVCDEFYEISEKLTLKTKQLKFKRGDKFFYPTTSHVLVFLSLNKEALSFYNYNLKKLKTGNYEIEIKEIIK